MSRPLTPEDLSATIERLLFFGPKPSGSLTYLDFPGLTAVLGSHPDPDHNRVGLSELSSQVADQLIATVVATYRRAGHGVVWYLTPRSLPHDLATRLETQGLRRDHDVDLAGLALSPLTSLKARPGADVRAVSLSQLREQVHVMAEGFGTPVDDSLATIDRLAAGAAPGFEFVQYLSYQDGVPVAFATAMIDHGSRVTLLGGGATLPSHRGKGHYQALVWARSEDARSRGSLAVVSHAIRTTSAPILLRLGFAEVVGIHRYVLPAPQVGPTAAEY